MSKKILEALVSLKEMKKIDATSLKEKLESPEVKEVAMETKANEVMNTEAVALGKELIPTNVLGGRLEMVPSYESLMTVLPGNQGTDMPTSGKYPIIGEANLMQANTEWTTGDGVVTPANNGPATDEIEIVQGQLITTIALSKRELNYSDEQLIPLVTDRINKAAQRTGEALIINADSATTGNVNLDGGTPSGFYYLQNAAGIRKTAIADGNTVTIGTLGESSFIDVMNLLDTGYAADYENLTWVMPRNVYNKCLLIDGLITRDKSQFDTLRTGRFGQIFGINVIVARDTPALTAANGKVSSTPASNTLGSFALVYKPAVQFGRGQVLEVEPDVKPGKGIQLVATMEMGVGIVYDKAGLGKTIGMGVGVTVA